MKSHAVSRRYARALFKLAEERKELDAVGRGLEIAATVIADPDIARALAGPIPRSQKVALVRTVAERSEAPASLRDFLLLVAEQDRLDHITGIRAVFRSLVDRSQGITRAKVRAAVVLPDDVLENITRVFGEITGKRVIPDVEVDGELIAGVIVEVEGRVYDGSLRTQLQRLHRQMATAG